MPNVSTYGYGFLFDAMARIAEHERDALLQEQNKRLCPHCDGSGVAEVPAGHMDVKDGPCPACDGKGMVDR